MIDTMPLHQVDAATWRSEDGKLLLQQYGDQLYLYDELGPRAEFNSLDTAVRFVRLVA